MPNVDTRGIPGALHEKLAKDFNPKVALMNICQYLQAVEEELTARIEALEAQAAARKGAKSKEAGQ